MTAPDAKEVQLLSQFRTRITDLKLEGALNTDHDLLRWIRAREWNLDDAETMIRTSMKWREENDMDNILSWVPPERLTQECPLDFVGYDYDNSPVVVVPFGRWDMKKVVDRGDKDVFIKFCDQIFAKLMKNMEGKFTPSGYPVTQFVFINNARGLQYKTLASMGAVDMFLQVIRRFEANQPETAKAFYVVNAGSVFAALFALMKPLLSKRTMSKVSVFTTNKAKWQTFLMEKIPTEVLPPALGGTNECVESDFLLKTEEEEEEEEVPPEFLEVTVPAGEKLTLSFSVEEGNSSITWAFKTDKYDISFAVNCDGKAYIEKSRVNSHEQVQEGKITCDTPGDYIFTFDNTYSRMRTKELKYWVDVRSPSGRKHISF